MLSKFWAVFQARNKEFYRDKAAMGWNFLFPILVVLGFSFAFSGKNQDLFKVGVHAPASNGQLPDKGPGSGFKALQNVQFVPITDREAALAKVRRHQLDLLIEAPETGGKFSYWVNSTSPKGYLLERLLWGSEPDRKPFERQAVEGQEIRYVDWLISGLLAMNMMFNALFGVGYIIVRYRKTGVLKRLKATPLTALEFLSAQIVSRVILIVFVTTLVFVGCHALIHFRMVGSYATLAVILLLGAINLISIGLLIAARVTSEEFAGGLLNLISWPMMFLSGVWFSLEGAHPIVQKVALVFPLTHVIDASRAVMTEGATLVQVAPNLIVLAVTSALFLAIGTLTFKWE